jgi:hypothetical protein
MKRGTTDHPKMLMLASLLGLEKWGAVGIMESVWHFTAKYAPQGDIGKYTREMIAVGIGWTGGADRLIDALIGAKWLDLSGQNELIVHDWSEHSDDYANKYLLRHGMKYADGKTPRRMGQKQTKKTTRSRNIQTSPELSRVSESESESGSESGSGSERERERGREREGFVDRLEPVVEALAATGKFEPGTLTVEILAEVDRTFPMVDVVAISGSLVLEAQSVAGKIGSVLPWLRKAVSRFETERAGVGGQKKAAPPRDDTYTDPRRRALAVGRD